MKATIVSLLPRALNERKPGLSPSRFNIEAAAENDFNILVVNNISYHMQSINDGQLVNVPVPADEVANSFCNDFIHSQLATSDEPYAIPGLFWVEGELTKKKIESEWAEKLASISDAQNNWFRNLIASAEDEWSRYHQHRMISDIQRLAAKRMNYEAEWTMVSQTIAPKRCPACQTTIMHQEAIICSTCRCVLDMNKYKSMAFATEMGGMTIPAIANQPLAPATNPSLTIPAKRIGETDQLNDWK